MRQAAAEPVRHHGVFGHPGALSRPEGELGTRELNVRLQALLNPEDAGKKELHIEGGILRVGDKVMHTRNNYDIGWTRDDGEVGSGVFNGDIGILEDIDHREDTLAVRYEDRVAFYTRQDAQDLELAYAVTVHKSQGSEFEAVLMPVFRSNPQLSYRNLLYTAVTRAKALLILVGSRDTVRQMVENNKKNPPVQRSPPFSDYGRRDVSRFLTPQTDDHPEPGAALPFCMSIVLGSDAAAGNKTNT